MGNANHPAWSFLRTLVVLVVFLVLLLVQANNPDWSELKVWIQLTFMALLAQGGHEILKARARKKE